MKMGEWLKGMMFLLTTLLLLMFASLSSAYIFFTILTYFSGDLLAFQSMWNLLANDHLETNLAFFLGIFFSLSFAILLKVGEHYGVVEIVEK